MKQAITFSPRENVKTWFATRNSLLQNFWGNYLVQRKLILGGARELSLLQNTQTSSSAHPASNSSFFCGNKVASADSLTTHIHVEPRLKISGAVPPLNLSATMAHIGTTWFYLYLLPMYVSLKKSHPFWSYKGTLLYITYPSHAHYMTHLFHLHWSIYINIMNSSNNETQFILLCLSFCY